MFQLCNHCMCALYQKGRLWPVKMWLNAIPQSRRKRLVGVTKGLNRVAPVGANIFRVPGMQRMFIFESMGTCPGVCAL